jgi:hypothetical protein
MTEPGALDSALMTLVQAIAADDATTALRLLDVSPALATALFREGAARQTAKAHYLVRSSVISTRAKLHCTRPRLLTERRSCES